MLIENIQFKEQKGKTRRKMKNFYVCGDWQPAPENQ